MNDNDIDTPQRSWLERISQAFSRDPQDGEQLRNMLREAVDNKIISSDAQSMIEGVLQVSQMQVRDIMIPRSQMVVIQEDDNPDDFLPIMRESQHSRYPVIGDNPDEVIGILLAKDLLMKNLSSTTEPLNLQSISRQATFVPESKRLDVLLKEFRNTHNHMAIVVDEYGGIAGLVTIEDVLEQIVGEIEDEYDIDAEDLIKSHADGSYIIKAHTPIEEFNEFFKTKFSDEDFDTLGGLVMQKFGHLPKRGESATLENFDFNVLHADNRRIRLLQARIHELKETS